MNINLTIGFTWLNLTAGHTWKLFAKGKFCLCYHNFFLRFFKKHFCWSQTKKIVRNNWVCHFYNKNISVVNNQAHNFFMYVWLSFNIMYESVKYNIYKKHFSVIFSLFKVTAANIFQEGSLSRIILMRPRGRINFWLMSIDYWPGERNNLIKRILRGLSRISQDFWAFFTHSTKKVLTKKGSN